MSPVFFAPPGQYHTARVIQSYPNKSDRDHLPPKHDTEAAIREIDDLMLRAESGSLPPRLDLEVLFAPAGPIQEVSVSSEWGQDFIRLADRFDAAAEDAYGRLRKNWQLMTEQVNLRDTQ